MSIIISVETSQSVVILTDGACYDEENRLTSIRRKIKTSEVAPVAIATRGSMHWGDIVAEHIVGMVERRGFDQAMAMLPLMMSQFALDAEASNRLEVVIAGISETRGPRHLVFTNIQHPYTGAMEPLSLQHPGQMHVGAATDGRSDGIKNIGIRKPFPWETPAEYFTENAVAIMQFYRECPVPPSSWKDYDKPAHIIGGQCDITIVSHAGVATRTLHRWNDKIGERIDPSRDPKPLAKPVPPVQPVNRQQRRAMERRRA